MIPSRTPRQIDAFQEHYGSSDRVTGPDLGGVAGGTGRTALATWNDRMDHTGDLAYVALDLETTGLDPLNDRVLELAAIRFNQLGVIQGELTSLVNPGPGLSIAAASANVHGISDRDLDAAPTTIEAMSRFLAFLSEEPFFGLVAHHAVIDAAFLGAELVRCELPIPPVQVLDTLALARRRFPDLKRHRLESLAVSLDLKRRPTHRAHADAQCEMDLWLKLDGPATPSNELDAYPIHDPSKGQPLPLRWHSLGSAISGNRPVWIVYEGGTRGTAPRLVIPREVQRRGGEPYLIAFCHLSRKAKAFRLSRVRSVQVRD